MLSNTELHYLRDVDASKRPKLTITYTIDPLVSYSYDDFGRLSTVDYANGVTETNSYHPDFPYYNFK